MQYATSMPAAVKAATVPEAPKSMSSGCAATTRTRSTSSRTVGELTAAIYAAVIKAAGDRLLVAELLARRVQLGLRRDARAAAEQDAQDVRGHPARGEQERERRRARRDPGDLPAAVHVVDGVRPRRAALARSAVQHRQVADVTERREEPDQCDDEGDEPDHSTHAVQSATIRGPGEWGPPPGLSVRPVARGPAAAAACRASGRPGRGRGTGPGRPSPGCRRSAGRRRPSGPARSVARPRCGA